MKRNNRSQRLNAQDAAKYRAIRRQVDRELPDLIERYHERMKAANDAKTHLQRKT